MSTHTMISGVLILGFALLKVKAMSQIREDGGATFHLYNTRGHEYAEPFEYAVKRESEPNGNAYVRVGRSHNDGTGDQDYGYGNGNGNGNEVGDGVKSLRGRSESFVRFGRSSLKVPHHKLDLGHGFERVTKSGGSKWVRVGRNVPAAAPSDAEMAVLSPNVLVERNVHCTKDLQQCYDKLTYVCGDNNNNNINGISGDGSEDHIHRNNFQYFDATEGIA